MSKSPMQRNANIYAYNLIHWDHLLKKYNLISKKEFLNN